MEELLKEKEMLAAIGTPAHQTSTTTSTKRAETSIADSFKKLVKALGDLSLTNQENERLLASLRKREENKIKVDNAYLEEVQKNCKLNQQIAKYQNQSLTTQMLAEVKKSIWHNMNANIT